MRLLLAAIDKKSGKSHQVVGVHTDSLGKITHINLEPNRIHTTWEKVDSFRILPLEVHVSNTEEGAE